ncbi:MAG: hypothetical protein IPJ68_05000 [Candidatus Moraniibacteriota bacterium]|nr:MAG: hypothetical protein IPJ68_05000 [Candidatus Moranbacteria bacterium]
MSTVTISSDLVLRVVRTADQVLAKAREMVHAGGRPDCSGGYLAWTFADGTPIIAGLMWGEMPLEKTAKRQEFALEKPTRLALYNLHLTSYRTRNPKATIVIDGKEVPCPRFGGAIRAGKYLLSFSGFPEKWDEAAMFVLAIKLGWISRETVFRHISPKRNPHLRPLLEACNWTE